MRIKDVAEVTQLAFDRPTSEKVDPAKFEAIKRQDWEDAFHVPPYPLRRRRYSARHTKPQR